MSAARPPIESVRAWVEGTLPAAERDAFAAAMAEDRSLADLVTTYAEVHAATVHPAPPCPVTADSLRLDATPTRAPIFPMLRRAAPWAAAVLVVAGAVTAIPYLRPADAVIPENGGALVLRAIRAPRKMPPAPPAILTRYTPETDGHLAFLDDLAEARATAHAAGRPLLVFVSEEMCPICRDMRHNAFREEAVARAANGFVLVAVAGSRLAAGDPLLQGFKFGKEWPIFVVEDASGTRRRVHGFPMNGRMPTGEDVAEELKKAYEAVPAAQRAHTLSWDDVHAMARALRDADDEAVPAARRFAWASVAGKDPKGPLGDRARALLAADADGARTALDAAKFIARSRGVAAAIELLDADIAAFDGTPYAADLRAVRDRASRDGAFPAFVLAR